MGKFFTDKFQGSIRSAKILIRKIVKEGGLINHMKKALLNYLIVTKSVSLNSEKLITLF